jgi:hypothetical protein
MAGRQSRPSTPHYRSADGQDTPCHDGEATGLSAKSSFIRHLTLSYGDKLAMTEKHKLAMTEKQ